MNTDKFYFENGMTVQDLKSIVKYWPEKNEDGEPTEVWVWTGKHLSSPVTYAGKLDMTDLILKTNAFD
jgi:hypothetical protein